MGRSVMTHSRSVETVYLHDVLGDDEFDQDAWDNFIEDLREGVLKQRFPSLSDVDIWEQRECHGILQNSFATVFVSEYCGCVAVDLVPDLGVWEIRPLAENWSAQVSKSFRETLHKAFPDSAMVSCGRFSNGEQVFAPVKEPAGVITSKEGRLW